MHEEDDWQEWGFWKSAFYDYGAEEIYITDEWSETVDGYTWKFHVNDGKAEIIGVSPMPTGVLSIPSVLCGKSVSTIESRAFYGCSELLSVMIPASVTSVSTSAFYGCHGLNAIEVSSNNPRYKSDSRLLLSKDGRTVVRGVNGDVVIPDSVTNIESFAFAACGGLTSVAIPNSVTSIGAYAFDGCSNLSEIDFKGTPPNVSSYVFRGVKDGAIGRYSAGHAAEWEAVIGADGKWNGLNMKPPPTLVAESANWSSGSITLRCTDADTSGAEHSYALEYCNENGTWVVVDDAQVSVTKGQNANNEEVWVVKLTDSAFSSRLGGIPPVQYHVKEVKSGRVSETCVTRNRHAIFVGLNEWQDKDLESTGGDSDANNFFNIAALRGGFSNSENIHVLLNRGAKVDDVDDAFDRVAESVQTGDIFLFYFRTHGGYDKSDGTTSLRLYDKGYTDTALATKIQSIEATGKSVAIIGIVAACHAGGMYDPDARLGHWYVANGLARCSANIAWIAAADREHTSYAVFNKFLLDYGWEEGWAGNDAMLSFLDLATYTKDLYEDLLSGIKSYQGWEVQIENPPLLRNVMAGTRGSHKDKLPPAAVTGIKSETGDRVDEIKTEWNVVDNADGYWLFCETGGGNEVCAAYSCPAGETEVIMSFQKLFGGSDFVPSKLPIKYSVKAVNGAGVSVASTVEVQNFARIVFDANGGGISGWRGALPREGIVYADITIGSILGGRLLTLPDAYGEDNKEFTGWFSVNGVQANPMAPIASDETYLAKWKAKNANGMTQDWLDSHQTIASASNGDIATAAAMSAANGCRTVGECYALGINPEDPNDDLRITDFKMENGKPVIKLNHTEDGSGNSFSDRVRTLGKEKLTDAEWKEVPESGNPDFRFFTIGVDMP